MVLRLWPDKCLKTAATPWKGTVEELAVLVQEMTDWMTMAQGIGLAAPQVGKTVQVALIQAVGQDLAVLVNPRIIWLADVGVTANEGCLSLPNSAVRTVRAKEIEVEYEDAQLNTRRTIFTDKEAAIVQHELDHLRGVTILDYASSLVKQLTKARTRAFKKKVARQYGVK